MFGVFNLQNVKWYLHMSISLFQWLRLEFEGGINLLAPSLPEFASQQEPIWTWPWSGLPAHICIVPKIFASFFFIFACVFFLLLHIFIYLSNLASHQELIWTWPWSGNCVQWTKNAIHWKMWLRTPTVWPPKKSLTDRIPADSPCTESYSPHRWRCSLPCSRHLLCVIGILCPMNSNMEFKHGISLIGCAWAKI